MRRKLPDRDLTDRQGRIEIQWGSHRTKHRLNCDRRRYRQRSAAYLKMTRRKRVTRHQVKYAMKWIERTIELRKIEKEMLEMVADGELLRLNGLFSAPPKNNLGYERERFVVKCVNLWNEGYTYREIADKLGIRPAEKVSQAVQYAKQAGWTVLPHRKPNVFGAPNEVTQEALTRRVQP